MLEVGVVVPIALEIWVQILFSAADRPVSAAFIFVTEVIIATMEVVPPPEAAEEVRAVRTEVNHRSNCRLSMFDAMVLRYAVSGCGWRRRGEAGGKRGNHCLLLSIKTGISGYLGQHCGIKVSRTGTHG